MKTKEKFPVLVIDSELRDDNAGGGAIRAIRDCIESEHHPILEATSAEDGTSIIASNPSVACVLVAWLYGPYDKNPGTAAELIERARKRNGSLPIFLMTERVHIEQIPLDVIRDVTDYIWKLEDTPDFIAGRVAAATDGYLREIMPPFFGEMVRFAEEHEYSWHTPGHSGGTAFLKSPTGRAFFDFYGEEMLRSDLSVSVPELGSLMEHTGVVGEAERDAAKAFGADDTYFVTNGTSSANKMVLHSTVTRGDVVLVDRNCHKSLQHALTMTGATPVYLIPSRNPFGIIGPIHPDEFKPETIKKKIADNPLINDNDTRPALAVVTNSTYDGLCYDIDSMMGILGDSVDRVHFDEAWFGYAAFNPIYNGRHGMHPGSGGTDGPTVFATQSTHKLLAALSQGSMVHVKQGRAPVGFDHFNEAFMMHTSTSPQYSIIASLDVATKMMTGEGGRHLTDDPIGEAVVFRGQMLQIADQLSEESGGEQSWWFDVWQPSQAPGSKGGDVDFSDAPCSTLETEPGSWTLDPDDDWHGFEGLDAGWCMLDPIKVTISTPGMELDGSLGDWGIPAAIVSNFLNTKGIVVEKTNVYSFLVLFSMGITKGKWGTLVTELLAFKKFYDEDAPLEDVFPDLVNEYPDSYKGKSLQQFCAEMHGFLKDADISDVLVNVFADLPVPEMTPADAYAKLVRGEVEEVAVEEMDGRTAAVMLVPYPPGIPILMPGERADSSKDRILDFLIMLQNFDLRFPGFDHEIHGVEMKEKTPGKPRYYTYGVK